MLARLWWIKLAWVLPTTSKAKRAFYLNNIAVSSAKLVLFQPNFLWLSGELMSSWAMPGTLITIMTILSIEIFLNPKTPALRLNPNLALFPLLLQDQLLNQQSNRLPFPLLNQPLSRPLLPLLLLLQLQPQLLPLLLPLHPLQKWSSQVVSLPALAITAPSRFSSFPSACPLLSVFSTKALDLEPGNLGVSTSATIYPNGDLFHSHLLSGAKKVFIETKQIS